MDKGLNLLNCLSSKSESLEKVLNILEIPDIFKLFLSIYEVDYKMLKNELLFINGRHEIFMNFQLFRNFSINNENYNATIDRILEYEALVLEYMAYKEKSENWHQIGLMKIGFLFHGDLLLLGIENDKRDEIWRYGNGLLSKVCCKLDNNIFEFFSRLILDFDTELLDEYNLDISSLYKKFGEDFWRVQE
jgi:hypothetical protein